MTGRDELGRFRKGCKGGPGRPSINRETDYLRALGAVVTVQDWKAVARKALEDAKAGDARARDWLSRYVMPSDDGLSNLDKQQSDSSGNLLEELNELLGEDDLSDEYDLPDEFQNPNPGLRPADLARAAMARSS